MSLPQPRASLPRHKRRRPNASHAPPPAGWPHSYRALLPQSPLVPPIVLASRSPPPRTQAASLVPPTLGRRAPWRRQGSKSSHASPNRAHKCTPKLPQNPHMGKACVRDLVTSWCTSREAARRPRAPSHGACNGTLPPNPFAAHGIASESICNRSFRKRNLSPAHGSRPCGRKDRSASWASSGNIQMRPRGTPCNARRTAWADPRPVPWSQPLRSKPLDQIDQSRSECRKSACRGARSPSEAQGPRSPA
mmetsp:Transcript_108511/g.242005  ORF Transcript_108511/g.242005 Transcript_108511/m.242005 type:complete len:249 (+) Transcript_108511:319-1065(+)